MLGFCDFFFLILLKFSFGFLSILTLWFLLGDIIYNAIYPLAKPDVIFGPEDEHFRPYRGTIDSKNALTDWNSKDPTRLLTLVLELRFGNLCFLTFVIS